MQKKFFLFTATAFLISLHLLAQDATVKKDTSYWKNTKQFGLTFNDAGFSSNFSAGGQNSWGVNAFLNVKGEYAKDKTTWVNDLQLQYGIISIGDNARKSIDRIFLDTKVGRKLSKNWSLVGGLNFQTQFYIGKKYGVTSDKDIRISNLFAPAFMTEYIGFEWKPKPFFNVVFAPGALRQTFVSDEAVFQKDDKGVLQPAYGVPVGKSFLNEVGIMQIVASFDKDVAKNVNLKLRYQMFINASRIEHIDNRLDAKMTAKINKYLSTTADLILLYYDTQSPKIQAASNLGIGFLYTF